MDVCNELVSQTLRKFKDKVFHGKSVLAFNAVVKPIALAQLLSICRLCCIRWHHDVYCVVVVALRASYS